MSSFQRLVYDQFDYSGCMEKIYITSDFDEYYEDFHNAMRKSELNQTRHLMRSPQLESRVKIIEFTRTLCTSRMLARTTLHLSCYIIDRFMDLFEVAEERLRMFCAVCVLIAAKLEDRSDCIPRWSDLQTFLGTKIESREYAILEGMIINALQWKINLPTAASFLEYYIVGSITIRDVPIRLRNSRPQLDNRQSSQSYPELRLTMYNLVYYLLDLSLNDVKMIGVQPSKLAAAAIMCARQIMCYRPYWNVELHRLSGYFRLDVAEIANDLRKLYLALNNPSPPAVTPQLLPRIENKRIYPFEEDWRMEQLKKMRH